MPPKAFCPSDASQWLRPDPETRSYGLTRDKRESILEVVESYCSIERFKAVETALTDNQPLPAEPQPCELLHLLDGNDRKSALRQGFCILCGCPIRVHQTPTERQVLQQERATKLQHDGFSRFLEVFGRQYPPLTEPLEEAMSAHNQEFTNLCADGKITPIAMLLFTFIRLHDSIDATQRYYYYRELLWACRSGDWVNSIILFHNVCWCEHRADKPSAGNLRDQIVHLQHPICPLSQVADRTDRACFMNAKIAIDEGSAILPQGTSVKRPKNANLGISAFYPEDDGSPHRLTSSAVTGGGIFAPIEQQQDANGQAHWVANLTIFENVLSDMAQRVDWLYQRGTSVDPTQLAQAVELYLRNRPDRNPNYNPRQSGHDNQRNGFHVGYYNGGGHRGGRGARNSGNGNRGGNRGCNRGGNRGGNNNYTSNSHAFGSGNKSEDGAETLCKIMDF